jgi:hypothetical protein
MKKLLGLAISKISNKDANIQKNWRKSFICLDNSVLNE